MHESSLLVHRVVRQQRLLARELDGCGLGGLSDHLLLPFLVAVLTRGGRGDGPGEVGLDGGVVLGQVASAARDAVVQPLASALDRVVKAHLKLGPRVHQIAALGAFGRRRRGGTRLPRRNTVRGNALLLGRHAHHLLERACVAKLESLQRCRGQLARLHAIGDHVGVHRLEVATAAGRASCELGAGSRVQVLKTERLARAVIVPANVLLCVGDNLNPGRGRCWGWRCRGSRRRQPHPLAFIEDVVRRHRWGANRRGARALDHAAAQEVVHDDGKREGTCSVRPPFLTFCVFLFPRVPAFCQKRAQMQWGSVALRHQQSQPGPQLLRKTGRAKSGNSSPPPPPPLPTSPLFSWRPTCSGCPRRRLCPRPSGW